MYTDQDSLGNNVDIFADNKPECENCALAMGLPVTSPMAAQEMLSEVPEKSDEDINIIVSTKITLSAPKNKLIPGEHITLSVETTPEGSNIPSLVWESSDISSAIITNDGVVYAGSKTGEVTITATNPDDNKITGTISLTVEESSVSTEDEEEEEEDVVEDNKVTKITVNPSTKTVKVGDEKFTVTATVEPEDATEPGVTWSSDSANATVDPETGEVTIVSEGSANIVATAKDGSGTTGKCAVTINAADEE